MRRLTVLFCLGFLMAAGCTSTGGDARSPSPSIKVVFLEDLSVEDAISMVVPAFQGATLAFDAAARAGASARIELVAQLTSPSELVSTARELVSDPSVVAVIVGPFLDVPSEAAGVFGSAGLPVLSLATGGPATRPTSWFQMVTNADAEAHAIAARLLPTVGGTVCFAGEGSQDSSALIGLVAGELGGRTSIVMEVPQQGPGSSAFADEVASNGCGALFWGGSGSDAAQIRLGLDAAGLADVTLVGSDAMMDPAFLTTAGAAGEGTVLACACVDITTSVGLAARRFIQNYQADFGSAPGLLSAEAWDVANVLSGALRGGARSRTTLLKALDGLGDYPGLAADYSFGNGGVGPRPTRLFVDEGGRWLALRPVV